MATKPTEVDVNGSVTSPPPPPQATTTPACEPKTSTASSPTPPTTATTSAPKNVVTIPVPIVSAEEIYTYVAIKGSLHAADCSVFGLNKEEIAALSKRFAQKSTEIVNGILITQSAIDIINSLSKLGYKVISSTGEAEIVWTLQREL